MTRQAVFPAELAAIGAATGFSPAVRAGDFLFLTGATGGDADGQMPPDADTQVRSALTKALSVITAAGGDTDSIVEITSYHTQLRADFDVIDAALREVLGLPLPAWTAVEVAGLRRAGAVVELRIVAHLPGQ
tara:strand:+ start:613 stop:1008 length:396 start_codon:yes stop_codon:yes gene_type:complete